MQNHVSDAKMLKHLRGCRPRFPQGDVTTQELQRLQNRHSLRQLQRVGPGHVAGNDSLAMHGLVKKVSRTIPIHGQFQHSVVSPCGSNP
jgi:hypothetical protein